MRRGTAATVSGNPREEPPGRLIGWIILVVGTALVTDAGTKFVTLVDQANSGSIGSLENTVSTIHTSALFFVFVEFMIVVLAWSRRQGRTRRHAASRLPGWRTSGASKAAGGGPAEL